MATYQIIAGLALLAVASAYPIEYGHAESYASISTPVHIAHHHHHEPLVAVHAVHAPVYKAEPIAHPKYAFKYGVHDAHTGDVKSQAESRDGGLVKGEYSLLQPDGTTRTVHYTADDHNGFNAVVTNTGNAIHPEVHHHAPVVQAAPIHISHHGASSYSSGLILGHHY